jgi:hypothetical protein
LAALAQSAARARRRRGTSFMSRVDVEDGAEELVAGYTREANAENSLT